MTTPTIIKGPAVRSQGPGLRVEKTIEKARGCGYRRPSADGVGIYLVGASTAVACGRLPFLLQCCPTCSGGIKPSRSWTWINSRVLFEVDARTLSKCRLPRTLCSACPVGDAAPDRAGLLWVGERFYGSPQEFVRESMMLGVSRKISAIPRDFKLGETRVYLAHRCAVVTADDDIKSGIFSCFTPTGIDLVVDDLDRVPERAMHIAEAIGVTNNVRIVQVERDVDTQGTLFEHDEEEHGHA